MQDGGPDRRTGTPLVAPGVGVGMEEDPERVAWFADASVADVDALATNIAEGAASEPADWPGIAVDTGFVTNEADYETVLHEAAVRAAATAVETRESATDRQLVHAIRTLDDLERVANELAERIAEWAATTSLEAPAGPAGAATLSETTPHSPVEARIVAIAAIVADLIDQRDRLEAEIERSMHDVAPNMSAIAGPLLGARLLSLAGDLETLARSPSGTVQVLGAEDALFAHLRGNAPSPKHGIIYTHPYVRETRPADRGSAARAFAGKLTIAARIDYYTGERRPSIDEELADRIATIRERAE